MALRSRQQLSVLLSQLRVFSEPDIRKEQYATDPDVASTILWYASMRGDIAGKRIADLGAGTGILGIGALLLDAKSVQFIESEPVKELTVNLAAYDRYRILHADLRTFTEAVDVVIMNPPFGTRERHIDREFLEHAMTLSPIIYSFHKSSTAAFFEKLAPLHGYAITYRHDFSFPLRKSYAQHRKSVERILVTCFRFEKNI
jgi:putative methylase